MRELLLGTLSIVGGGLLVVGVGCLVVAWYFK